MADKRILHLLSPLRHASPFDLNMALDAGYDAVIPYTNVTIDDVANLVQDAIFSRPPKDGAKTCVFIGGKDAIAALDMLERAKQAMVPPFVLSLFVDPAGSFTTAAAMVARLERALRAAHGRELAGTRILVFGATGVVGFASAVISALEGAQVTLVGYDGIQRVQKAADEIAVRFGAAVAAADGSSDDLKAALLRDADVALCAGRAGVEIISSDLLDKAADLLAVADVNAVPPLGVAGLDVFADGVKIGNGRAVGIGPLAIGQTKYQTEFGLFRRMLESAKPVTLDFRDAFALARELAR
ncbi:MAG TPA: NAD(P)-dependent methylenetetrahydromethanopterin dehydrogenase [Rhodopila sp.]|nr:NAD(P)-dependent methylenetetrahydromethanopterin dehydrogenase [Rhodopila sp.]